MCEKCNCETSENICQEGVKLSKKDYIENSLNTLFDSLESLEYLDYKISNSSEGIVNGNVRSKIIFESLEELLNGLPEGLYKFSERINKLVENINAKLF